MLGAIDYVVIGLMLAVSACVGLYFRFTGGRQKTTREFLMAGKDMSVGPVAFSLMATYMSAISVLGMPAETYQYGTQFFMWMAALPFGAMIAAYAMLPVFFHMDVTTAYEYLEKRFGKVARTVAAVLFTLQMMLYMAVVLYAPSLALNAVTGLSVWTSVISLAAVCTFYCSLGGLKAVLWTDVFQATLMYVAIIAVVAKVSSDIGLLESLSIAHKGGRLVFFDPHVDLTSRYTLLNALVSGFMFSFHTFGTNQAQIQRMLSVGNLKKAQKALFLSVPLIFVFNLFCFWDGVVIYSKFHDCDPMMDPNTKLQSADQLMPFAILKLFDSYPGLTGLCIAGVFSASLSTISSAVNSLTAVTMEDFIRPFCFCKKLTETWATFLAKILAIAYGALCLLLTFLVSNFRGIIEASNVMFGMIGGPVLGLYVLGMFTVSANEPGSLIGLFVGFALCAWLGFGSYAAKAPIPSLIRTIDGCPGLKNETMYALLGSNSSYISNTFLRDMAPLENNIEDERYVPVMYRISFMWYPFFGALTTIFVGYLASFITSFWIKQKVFEAECASPIVRKWLFKSKEDPQKNGTFPHEVEMNIKTTNESQNVFKVYKNHVVMES